MKNPMITYGEWLESKEEIKNCPFCGAPAKITLWSDAERAFWGLDSPLHSTYRIECNNGHALDDCRDTEEEAIEVWNQRV